MNYESSLISVLNGWIVIIWAQKATLCRQGQLGEGGGGQNTRATQLLGIHSSDDDSLFIPTKQQQVRNLMDERHLSPSNSFLPLLRFLPSIPAKLWPRWLTLRIYFLHRCLSWVTFWIVHSCWIHLHPLRLREIPISILPIFVKIIQNLILNPLDFSYRLPFSVTAPGLSIRLQASCWPDWRFESLVSVILDAVSWLCYCLPLLRHKGSFQQNRVVV